MRKMVFVMLFVFVGIASVSAQDAVEEIQAEVLSVTGTADYVAAGLDVSKDESWKPIIKGMMLKSGDLVMTGDRAIVELFFAANSTRAVIEQFTEMKLDMCYKQAGKVVQDLRLVTGTIAVDVQDPSVQTDMQIATPEATASVKGTLTIANRSAGQGSTFSVVRGLVSVGNGKGGSRNIGAGEKTNGNLLETLKAAKLNPDAVVNILPGGTPGDEVELLLINYTGAVSLLPSDLTGGGNPVIDKIIQQEGIAGQQKEEEDEDYGELPPQHDE